jgi:transcriptional repressor NrdR
VKCPFCEHEDSRVLDSRETEDHTSIRRRRECGACVRRFTTYERYDEAPLWVVKKNLTREKFERDKVLRGIASACRKRPISPVQQEAIVNHIERDLRSRGDSEVSCIQIGEMVMQYLKGLDHVAYVRFASVYKEFQTVGRFAEELEELGARQVDPGAAATLAAPILR